MSITALIHANIHRIKEGSRVLEDIARFILRDENLFKAVRELRHSIKAIAPDDQSQSDLGGPVLKENNIRHHLVELVQANFLRIQEALRVLEEMSQEATHKHEMKTLRYTAYQLHQQFYKKVEVFVQKNKLKGLYLIIDTDFIKLPIKKIADIINQSSVTAVQLRNKKASKHAFLEQAIEFKNLLHSDKLFIINDHIDIALDIAHGVHLGQQDYPIDRVRKYLPSYFVLGVTCHDVKEAKLAYEAGASYISVGCLFPTQSKSDTVPVSLNELEKIRQAIDLPICAIGGIDQQHLSTVLATEVDMIAMISTIWQSPNPLKTIETIQDCIKNKVLKD